MEPELRPSGAGGESQPDALCVTHFKKLYFAVYASHRLGCGFNVTGTIAWFLEYGLNQQAAAEGLARFLKNYSQWMEDHQSPHGLYIYVTENQADESLQTHFMLYVPSDLVTAFRPWIKTYFRKTFGHRKYKRGFLRMRVRRKMDARAQWDWFRFMCRGFDPAAVLFRDGDTTARLGDVIRVPHEDPGQIEAIAPYGISHRLHRKQYEELLRHHQRPDSERLSPLDIQIKARKLDVACLYGNFTAGGAIPLRSWEPET